MLMMVVLAACSGGPSVADYAEDLETLVVTMNASLDTIDAQLDDAQDLKSVKDYASERILVRTEFLTGLRNLRPAEDIAELHETALEIMKRVTDAEAAMVDRVMGWESVGDIEAIWETPEGLAARTADEQAVALCLVAQAGFDQTSDRADLKDVPWIPTAMKEVIRVVLGCEADQR